MPNRRWLAATSLAAAVTVVTAVAQNAAAVRWNHKAAKSLADVAVDAAGNTYATGWTLTADGDQAAILLKYGPAGSKLWSRVWFPGAAGLTAGTAVTVAPDGSVYWGGSVTIPGCEGHGWFVRRLEPSGRLVWHRDQPGWQKCRRATALTDLDAGSGIIVFSVIDHGCCGDPFADGYVRALTTRGASRWVAPFEPPAAVPHRFFDRATGVAVGSLDHVFVGGWAATERVSPTETAPGGRVVIAKISPQGGVLWSRASVRVPFAQTDATVAVRGDRLMVASRARGGNLNWGGKPPSAWLARFTVAGERVWARIWGRKWRFGAEPAEVSIDATLGTWVIGTRRDPSDRGFDLFVRRFSKAGGVTRSMTFDGPTRYFHGTGIAARGAVSITGWVGSQQHDDVRSGRLLRL
jgi:hypothetical protein